MINLFKHPTTSEQVRMNMELSKRGQLHKNVVAFFDDWWKSTMHLCPSYLRWSVKSWNSRIMFEVLNVNHFVNETNKKRKCLHQDIKSRPLTQNLCSPPLRWCVLGSPPALIMDFHTKWTSMKQPGHFPANHNTQRNNFFDSYIDSLVKM